MGTKNNPGKYDCYEKAEPDEPVFILLGRDPVAWVMIGVWANIRVSLSLNEAGDAATTEALVLAQQMRAWAIRKGKEALVKRIEAMAGFVGGIFPETLRWPVSVARVSGHVSTGRDHTTTPDARSTDPSATSSISLSPYVASLPPPISRGGKRL